MTDKGNYTGRLEDVVSAAQGLQEQLQEMKADYLNDKDYRAKNEEQGDNRNMVIYLIDKRIHALDTVIDGGIDFNIT